MRLTEQVMREVTDLYWLAFLITNRQGLSLDLAIDALTFQPTADGCFAGGRSESPRLLVIREALAAVNQELAASAHRTEMDRSEPTQPLPSKWTLDPSTTKAELERALLDIDVFPRCALLLTVYERLPMHVASMLMDANANVIRKGIAFASTELTRNLARQQGWRMTTAAPADIRSS